MSAPHVAIDEAAASVGRRAAELARMRPPWFPTCLTCTVAWRALHKTIDSLPASVPVEHAIVIREQHGPVYELALVVRCHGKRDRLGVTHVRDESELARYTFFPSKGAK